MSRRVNRIMFLLAAKRIGLLQELRNLAVGTRGSLLIEAVVATTIFTIVGSAVLVGLSTTHISGAKTEEQSVAENIARNQMEKVFSLPYLDPPSTYPAIATSSGYGVSAAAEEYVVGDPNIEKVVVRVTHESEEVLVLETMRAKE